MPIVAPELGASKYSQSNNNSHEKVLFVKQVLLIFFALVLCCTMLGWVELSPQSKKKTCVCISWHRYTWQREDVEVEVHTSFPVASERHQSKSKSIQTFDVTVKGPTSTT
jgi:hypothetical protein